MWDVVQELYFVLVEPILLYFGLASLGFGDPTYGRENLPYSPQERAAVYENPEVKVTRRRVYLHQGKPVLDVSIPDNVRVLPCVLSGKRVTAWINYYIWEMPNAPGRDKGVGFMLSGFRVIALDMPSFGRSSGLHSYLYTMRWNVDALDAVMYHVRTFDEAENLPNLATRKRFAQGSSMGGFTVLYHCALHPPVATKAQGGPETHDRLALDGIAVSAPMLRIAPESRPNMFVEMVGRLISLVAGRLPLARAIKGNVSDDPKVEFYARQDPQVYHGLVRVDTGLAIIAGIDHLNEIVSQIRCPVAIHHGSHDRVTSPEGSRVFFDKLDVQPKKLRIWPGIEHAMLKSTPEMSVKDLERRNALVEDMASWFIDLTQHA